MTVGDRNISLIPLPAHCEDESARLLLDLIRRKVKLNKHVRHNEAVTSKLPSKLVPNGDNMSSSFLLLYSDCPDRKW